MKLWIDDVSTGKTCKDCIHFNDCLTEQQTRYYGKVCACSNVEKLCKYFKDKSRFVELPCKVGDTVYEFFDVIGFYDITELIVENIVVGVNPSKCQVYCKSKISNSKLVFYEDSFGKTLFFTKEEAEEKLRELQNE